MATLYDLTQTVQYLQDLLETGEIDDQTYCDTIESLMAKDKIENVCKVIRNLEAKSAALKEEEARLAAKRKAADNGVARLKSSLYVFLAASNVKKLDAGVFTVSYRDYPSVQIENEDKISDDFRIPQPDKIDRAAIKKVLQSGAEIDGTSLVYNPSVTVK